MKLDPLVAVLLLGCISANAQISPPKEKAADYPVHVAVPNMELAADYLVHSLPGPKGVLFVQDYLIVEVAAYPTNLVGAAWATGQFSLRINKKGTPVLPQAPGMVAASVKYPDWVQRPTAVAQVGVDDKSVIFGQPTPVGRFPGDPAGVPSTRPRVPSQEDSTAENQAPEMTIDEICQRQALYDGPIRKPVNGFLYFPFSGKLKSIHSLELLYETVDGTKATLTLL